VSRYCWLPFLLISISLLIGIIFQCFLQNLVDAFAIWLWEILTASMMRSLTFHWHSSPTYIFFIILCFWIWDELLILGTLFIVVWWTYHWWRSNWDWNIDRFSIAIRVLPSVISKYEGIKMLPCMTNWSFADLAIDSVVFSLLMFFLSDMLREKTLGIWPCWSWEDSWIEELADIF
jgi:hypothetical protein